MVHETTVERVTNRVWSIFSSLDHGIAGNNDRRALLRAYIASLAERGEHNADKLTIATGGSTATVRTERGGGGSAATMSR